MKLSLAVKAVLGLTGAGRAESVNKSGSELHAVFEEFLNLVPVEQVKSIVVDYFENDPEVRRAVEYIASEDFKKFVRKIESIEDVINFYAYLQESGLDVYDAMNQLHEAIALPPPGLGTPTGLRTAHGKIAGLVADIKAILPLEDIKAMHYDKLKTSPVYARFVNRLYTREFQKLVDALLYNDSFLWNLSLARHAGLDIFPIVDLLKILVGLDLPTLTQQLEHDLLDFINLLPSDAILNIQKDYVDDPELKEFERYVQSEEFAQKVEELASIKEVKDFVKYCQESGINDHRFLEMMHDAVKIPSLEPTSLARKTNGVVGFIAEITAVLPMKEIKALHEEKRQNSAAFLYLFKRMTSMELWAYYANVIEHEQARAIIDGFASHGINYAAATSLFASIFGFL